MTMKPARQLFVLIPLMFLLSGCSSLKQQGHCILAGGAGGLILGAMETAGAAATGGAGLAILGGLLCHSAETDKGINKRCPFSAPKGTKFNRRGCPVDSDNDGVPNYLDLCPNTPANTPVDASGCPDSDKDGVADNVDQCPNTPPGTRVDDKGCPIILIKPLGQIQFKFDKSTLSDKAKAYLDGVAYKLKANPKMKLNAYGHTDISGPPSHNEGLCLRRAKSVTDYLIEQGVSSEQVEPYRGGIIKEHNDTRDGRARNRRVELNTEEE
ncbi:hypothetical protein EOPP23_17020 [Endozoicomonas sp. OPT23]|uniref:OmpA family protein n=1 Tax=Endozoicomonas sp. OPT23 TaxID=2072845 RepID=UPI00129B6D97|nr:OmpA family protein [Endozoicomonas sp. OPT23]MRI34687.1 hypothetical protein [Endozoicomonas sp. OPT23]